MTSSERFVLDTNVIVSAVLSPRSVPRQAFDRAFLLGTVLVSDSILVEVDDVLRRPKFERYVSEEERLQFLAKFVGDATIVEVTEVVTDCRDSKDNKFLELAVSSSATVLSAVIPIYSYFILSGVSQFSHRKFLSAKCNRETRPIYQESKRDRSASELGDNGAEVCEGDAA